MEGIGVDGMMAGGGTRVAAVGSGIRTEASQMDGWMMMDVFMCKCRFYRGPGVE